MPDDDIPDPGFTPHYFFFTGAEGLPGDDKSTWLDLVIPAEGLELGTFGEPVPGPPEGGFVVDYESARPIAEMISVTVAVSGDLTMVTVFGSDEHAEKLRLTIELALPVALPGVLTPVIGQLQVTVGNPGQQSRHRVEPAALVTIDPAGSLGFVCIFTMRPTGPKGPRRYGIWVYAV